MLEMPFFCELWLKEAEKQQHVNVAEKILFKCFTTRSVRNYDQKYSSKRDSDGRRRSGFLAVDDAES